MITEEEFIQRLKEDKFPSDPKELIEYRLPVVQYYLTNYTNSTIVNTNTKVAINSKNILIIERDEDFTLINIAFEGIKNQLKELEK